MSLDLPLAVAAGVAFNTLADSLGASELGQFATGTAAGLFAFVWLGRA